MKQTPTIGRVVVMQLNDEQLARVPNQNNGTRECPAVIVRVWSDQPDGLVNLQCLVDGPGPLWLSSVRCGDNPGQWRWPQITPPSIQQPQDAKY